MIERMAITGAGSSSEAAQYDLAKQIADLIVKKVGNAYICAEYLEGKVIKITGMDVAIGVYSNNTRIHFCIMSQKNDSLSENTTELNLTVDFDTVQYILIPFRTPAKEGVEYKTDWNVTVYSNGQDVILDAGSRYGYSEELEYAGFESFAYLHDEDNEQYVGLAYTYMYDSDSNYYSTSSIFTPALYLRRDNVNAICMMQTFLNDGIQYTKRLKNIYNILRNDNIVTKSRYKIDGDEYFALTDTLLFRLEGDD